MIPSVWSLDYRFCAWGAVLHASSDRWPGPLDRIRRRTHDFQGGFLSTIWSLSGFTPFHSQCEGKIWKDEKDVSRESCALPFSHLLSSIWAAHRPMLGAWHQTCLFTWAVVHVTDTACPSQHPRNAPPNRNQVATGPERPKTTCVQLSRAKYYDYSNLSQLLSTRNHWLLRLLHTLSQVVSWKISDSGCASSHLDTSPRWTWHSVDQRGDSTIRQFMLVYLDGQLAGQFCQQLCIGTCRDLKNEDLKSFDIEVSLKLLEEIDRFCLASFVFIVSSSGLPTLRLVAAHQHQRLCPFSKDSTYSTNKQ